MTGKLCRGSIKVFTFSDCVPQSPVVSHPILVGELSFSCSVDCSLSPVEQGCCTGGAGTVSGSWCQVCTGCRRLRVPWAVHLCQC